MIIRTGSIHSSMLGPPISILILEYGRMNRSFDKFNRGYVTMPDSMRTRS